MCVCVCFPSFFGRVLKKCILRDLFLVLVLQAIPSPTIRPTKASFRRIGWCENDQVELMSNHPWSWLANGIEKQLDVESPIFNLSMPLAFEMFRRQVACASIWWPTVLPSAAVRRPAVITIFVWLPFLNGWFVMVHMFIYVYGIALATWVGMTTADFNMFNMFAATPNGLPAAFIRISFDMLKSLRRV